jgi:hypothetical protein
MRTSKSSPYIWIWILNIYRSCGLKDRSLLFMVCPYVPRVIILANGYTIQIGYEQDKIFFISAWGDVLKLTIATNYLVELCFNE